MINCEPHEVTSLEHTVWNKKYVTFVLNFFLICLALSIFDASASMKVRRFEWSPSVVTLGETTTFYWHIEGAEFCFGNNKRRTAVGNNGRQLFTSPTDKTTSWYCQDSSGERIYLNARIRVLPHAPGKASTPFATRYVPINTRQTISWSSVSGADYYNLFQNESRYYQGYGRSRTISSSTVGTNSYKVNACNAGGCGAWSGSRYVTFFDKPGMVSNLSSNKTSLITGESALISWGQASGIVPGFNYQVHLNGSLYKTTTQLSTSVVLDDEGSNTVAVYACNPESVGCSSARTVNINAIGKPATPSSIPDVVGGSYHPYSTTVQLSLPAVANATYYQVYMSTTDSNYQLQPSANQVTLRGDWGYNYLKYRACNNAGCSELSSWRRTHSYGSPHQAYPTASSNLVTSGNTVKISWPNPRQIIYSGTYYERQIVSPSNKVTSLSALNHVSGASSTDFTSPKLVEGGVYTFKVRACNPSLPCGPWGSTNVNVAVAITQAPNLDIGNAYHPINSSKEIKWSSIIGAKRYELYEDSSKIHDYNSQSDSVSHANYGRRYYKVRACNEIGCGPYSTTLPIYYYTAPGGVNNFKATPSNVEVGSNSKLTWDLPGGDVPGISYVISKDGAEISRTTNRYLDVVISSLQNTFSIVACNPENVGCGSARTVSIEGTPITKPTLAPTISNGHYHPINSTINVNTTELNGAANYRLKVETGTLDGANKQEVLNKTFTGSTTSFSSAKAGYHFISYAQCKGNYCSEYSPALRIVMYGAPNYAKSVMADPSSVSLGANSVIKWAFSGVRVGGHYKLKQIRPDGTIKQYTNITQSTGIFDFEQVTESLTIAGTHTFKIDSCNDDSHCSGDVNVTVNVLPATPEEIPAVAGGNYQRVNSNVPVNMPIIPGAQSYKLKVQTGNLEGTNKQPATESIAYQGNIAKFTPQSIGYYFLSYAHCSNGVCSEYGPELRIHVYGKSDEVTGLSVDKDQTFIGMRANINWKWASGIRVNGHYKVTHTLPSGSSNASYNPIIIQEAHDAEHEVMSPTFNVPGNHIFTVQSCNDDSLCSDGVSIDVRVINPVIVNRFEWSPNVVLAGQSTTFYWDVTGVDKCGRTDENDKKGWRAPSGNNGTQVFSIGSDQTTMLVHTKWKCLIDEGKPSEIQYPVGENNFLTANLTVLKEPDGINMPVLSKVSDSLKWTYNSTADNYQIQAASCGDNCSEITQSAWETVANVTDKRYLLPDIVESKVYRVQACNSQNECGAHSNNVEVTSLNTVKVNRFEWVPNVSLIGQPTTFYWDIGGVENCRRADPEDKKGWRGVVGDNGTQIFEQPFEKDSIWECYTDINDVTTRYPSDPSKFISAPIKVLESPDGVSIPLLKKTSDTLTWSVIANAQRYELQQYACSERCTDLVEANWQLAQENASTSFTLPNDDTKRTYRVKACFADESCTAWSNVVSNAQLISEVSSLSAMSFFTPNSFAKTNDTNSVSAPEDGTGNIVGKTAGQFKVDETGSATYFVPFVLPVGSGGIKPELGLSYTSSNTRLGDAGIGWSIVGVSVIQRCPRSKFYDELNGKLTKGIQFDDTDAFCVNGSRLIETSSNVYRTEVDDFTLYEKVTSGSNIVGFIATTKSNDTYYYGNPDNISGSTAVRFINSDLTNNVDVEFSWHLNKVVDLYGNEIEYRYKGADINTSINQETLLDTITYNSNTVTFDYVDVENKQFSFAYGNTFNKTKTLASVTISTAGQVTKYYELSYQDSAKNEFLEQIQECARENSYCFEPIKFEWNQEYPQHQVFTKTDLALGQMEDSQLVMNADVNGDGYSDFIRYMGKESFRIEYGNGFGSHSYKFSHGKIASNGIKIADMNGDGRQDILVATEDDNWYLIYNRSEVGEPVKLCDLSSQYEPECFSTKNKGRIDSSLVLTNATTKTGQAIDINGDGLLDVVYQTYDKVNAHINQSTPGNTAFSEKIELLNLAELPSSLTFVSPDIIERKVKYSDFDGDGLTDMFVNLTKRKCAGSSSSGCVAMSAVEFEQHIVFNDGDFKRTKLVGTQRKYFLKFYDFNHDGYSDLMYQELGEWYVELSNGAGFQPKIKIDFGNLLNTASNHMKFDVNGDGRQEILTYEESLSRWKVWRLIYNGAEITLTPTGKYVYIEKKNEDKVKDSIQFADRNGDGIGEWIRVRATTKGVSATIHNPLNSGEYVKHNVIGRFYDTLGNSTRVTYKPLTDNTVYLGGLKAVYPFISVVSPVYVVSNAFSTNGVGGESEVQYQYANLAMHAEGKGYLGFGKLVTLDKNNPGYIVRSTTLYHQGFIPSSEMSELTEPEKIGLPYSTVKEISENNGSSWFKLSESSNDYEYHTTASANSASVLRSPIFVYPASIVDKEYHLIEGQFTNKYASSEIQSITTNTSVYDTYGNVLSNNVSVTDGIDSFTTSTLNHYKNDGYCFGYSSSVTQDFTHDYERFGRLTCTKVTKTREESGNTKSDTRVAAFGYNTVGVLNVEIANLQSTELQVNTSYGFDDFGNTISKVVSGNQLVQNTTATNEPIFSGNVVSSSSYKFDKTGRFLTEESNGLGYKTCFEVSPITGLVKSKTTNVVNCDSESKINGYTTQYRHNAMGQLTAEIAPDRTVKRISRNINRLAQLHEETVEQSGALPVTTIFDSMGRKRRTVSQTYEDGVTRVSLIEYDALGRVYRKSIPLKGDSVGNATAASSQWSVTDYDLLGRTTSKTVPSFNGAVLTLSMTFGKNYVIETEQAELVTKNKKTISNVIGETVQVINGHETELSTSTFFSYDAYGQLQQTTDDENNQIVIQYDLLGNKIQNNDPDKGIWHYRYNALGQLKWQKDANGNVTWLEYDQLGRITQKINSVQSNPESRCYTYDSLAPLGAKDSEYVTTGATCNDTNAHHSKTYIYGDYGRLESVSSTIQKNNTNHSQLNKSYYDNLGRVYLNQISNFYALGYTYDVKGRVVETHGLSYDPQSQSVTTELLKSVNAVNYRGQASQITYLDGQVINTGFDAYTGLSTGISTSNVDNNDLFGNISANYQYNAFGQLKTRTFNGLFDSARIETFEYDELNRLESQTVSVNSTSAIRYYCYNKLGNLLSKGASEACTSSNAQYEYGDSSRGSNNAGPHALRYNKATQTDYHYDDNGNMIRNGNRNFSYSSFDKVTEAWESGNQHIKFDYDANHRRYYRKDTYLAGNAQSNAIDTETFYFGALERIEKADSNELTYQYAIGNIILTFDLVSGETSKSLHIKDHLGSTIAISDDVGKVQRAFYYDPFGQQHSVVRNGLENVENYNRFGFTGHEMLNGLNFIHMNGRIYDPTIGRFLQADPFVQFAHNSQSYNRYSYVLNNPLSFTDPSGYFVKWLAKKLLGKEGLVIMGDHLFGREIQSRIMHSDGLSGIVSVALNFVPGCQVWCSALFSANRTYYHTGSLGRAFHAGGRSALTATVFWGIGATFDVQTSGEFFTQGGPGHIFTHALAGGIIADLQGGKFAHGFISAGLTKGFHVSGMLSDNMIIGTLQSAIVGGTASAISGGKFANGAVTAAFQFLYNAYLTNQKLSKTQKALDRLAKAGAKFKNMQEMQNILRYDSLMSNKQFAKMFGLKNSAFIIEGKRTSLSMQLARDLVWADNGALKLGMDSTKLIFDVGGGLSGAAINVPQFIFNEYPSQQVEAAAMLKVYGDAYFGN